MAWVVVTLMSWGRCPEITGVHGPFDTVEAAQMFAAAKQVEQGVDHINVEELHPVDCPAG